MKFIFFIQLSILKNEELYCEALDTERVITRSWIFYPFEEFFPRRTTTPFA